MLRPVIAALIYTNLLVAAPKIEVLKMQPSPFNENAIIKRMYSENDIIGGKAPLLMQVIDFPIGVNLPNRPEWLKGMRENGAGSMILLWVYGPNQFQKRFYLTKDNATSFVEDKTYFKDRYRKYFKDGDLPSNLEGQKIGITSILINAFGESLKTDKATRSIVIDYMRKGKESGDIQKGFDSPRLVYNEPYGNYLANQSIMLDFYIFNADLGQDGFSVELYIDGVKEEVLYDWAPYRIRNLQPGIHEVKLVLIDPTGKAVDEIFGEQKNTISVGK